MVLRWTTTGLLAAQKAFHCLKAHEGNMTSSTSDACPTNFNRDTTPPLVERRAELALSYPAEVGWAVSAEECLLGASCPPMRFSWPRDRDEHSDLFEIFREDFECEEYRS